MNFVRLLNTLPESPKVAKLARFCKVPQDSALGLMVRWLCWVDKYLPEPNSGLTPKEIDNLVFGYGVCLTKGLLAIGWVELDDQGCVCVTEFEKYCSPTAKRRLKETAKKRATRVQQKKHEEENL